MPTAVRCPTPIGNPWDGRYRVWLEGAWHDVPEDAVVTVPNRAGKTMVWPVRGSLGLTIICFMPGPMT